MRPNSRSRIGKILESTASDWISAGRYVLAWSIPALIAMVIKIQILRHGGLRIIARHLGSTSNKVSFGEMISLFQADLLIGFVLLPLGFLILTKILHRKLRGVTLGVICIGMLFFLYVHYQSWLTVGRFLSVQLFFDSLWWGISDPHYIKMYLDFKVMAVLFVSICAIVLIIWWARKRESFRTTAPPNMKRQTLGILFAFCPIVLAGISYIPDVKPISYHESILVQTAEKFVGLDEQNSTEFINLKPQELVDKYYEITKSPPPKRDSVFSGKAHNSNVIFFVFETGPAKCLDLGGNLEEFPAIRRLKEKAFVAEKHYSTYPYTARAIFSLLSSQYPSNSLKDFIQQDPNLVAPGVMRSLSNSNYITTVYKPRRAQFPMDEAMYKALGLSAQVIATPVDQDTIKAENPDWKEAVIREDLETFKLLQMDIRKWKHSGKNFAAIYLPQVGHGPWPTIGENKGTEKKSMVERGRAFMSIQDAWLGDLIELLEQQQQLEKTLIVITSDHGVRTHQEDPDFQGGMIDEYTFNVPFMLYAPQVLDSTYVIPWLTSHIDVGPTVLELLGVYVDREFEQGSPVWDESLRERKTYFLGNHYLGADGYHSNGRFSMWSQVSDAVYQHSSLHFDINHLIPHSYDEYHEVTSAISQMVALQDRWYTLYMRANFNRVGMGAN